ncbi:MAG TPA: hypothetical protein VK106_00310 [Balneolaceae bacterium]|nr:hypothetical protein [Balneolaceae bacterium]
MSKTTTDHNTIKTWIEERKGRPAVVKDTANGNGGVLRIDYGKKDESLASISWDEFFDIFEENDLAFLYQEESESGDESRFSKFIQRENM